MVDSAHHAGDAGSLWAGSVGVAALVASAGIPPPAAVADAVPATASPAPGSVKATGRSPAPATPPSTASARVPGAPAAGPSPTTVPPGTHAAAAPHRAPPNRSQQGVASWLGIAAGTCADNAAPMGATLTVTNAVGISITCKVVSRGPFSPGRVVDLAEATFALLGSTSQGLLTVTVTW